VGELKACPFCGSEPVSTDETDRDHVGGWSICCENNACFAEPIIVGRTEAIAVERWNTRPTPSLTDGDLKRAAIAFMNDYKSAGFTAASPQALSAMRAALQAIGIKIGGAEE